MDILNNEIIMVMKELSTEEKAKRYEEALGIAKVINNEHKAQPFDVMLKVFPELKDSEDERIRKALIEVFSNREKYFIDQSFGDITVSEALDWLKKQGEHANFRNKIQVGDKVTRNKDGVLVNLSRMNRAAKPAEEYNIRRIGSKHAEGKLAEKIKELNDMLEKQGEHSSVWSKEDEEKQKAIIGILDFQASRDKDRICASDGFLLDDLIDWLKSIKDRVLPQPNQEWGEEDKKMSRFIGNAITTDEASMYLESKEIQVIDAHVWLEELKERVQPHNSDELKEASYQVGIKRVLENPESYGLTKYNWKPSDEQIYWLKWAIGRMPDTEIANEAEAVLKELLADLEKLKEC